MLVKTKYFGEVDLTEEKIITFNDGIMGFEDYKKYTLLYDVEEGKKPKISWLQSTEEPTLALPVISPLLVREDYNPVVEDETLQSVGELNEDNLVILLALTVPSDVQKMSANLKAPFIMNADTRMGVQVIVENQDYPVKHYIYEELQKQKEAKGENRC